MGCLGKRKKVFLQYLQGLLTNKLKHILEAWAACLIYMYACMYIFCHIWSCRQMDGTNFDTPYSQMKRVYVERDTLKSMQLVEESDSDHITRSQELKKQKGLRLCIQIQETWTQRKSDFFFYIFDQFGKFISTVCDARAI